MKTRTVSKIEVEYNEIDDGEYLITVCWSEES